MKTQSSTKYLRGNNPLSKISTGKLIMEVINRNSIFLLTLALALTWTFILVRATN